MPETTFDSMTDAERAEFDAWLDRVANAEREAEEDFQLWFTWAVLKAAEV